MKYGLKSSRLAQRIRAAAGLYAPMMTIASGRERRSSSRATLTASVLRG